MATMAGLEVDYQVVPFRGEYFALPQERRGTIRHLIYPVPDPDLPFLGIHLTLTIDGGVTVGPNAVLGMGRECYPKGQFSGRDIRSFACFPGFWKMLARNYRSAITEGRNSLFKRHYLEQCRKYCPSLTLEDLQPHVAGIRAQLVRRDGSLVHDFLFEQTKRMLHVCQRTVTRSHLCHPYSGPHYRRTERGNVSRQHRHAARGDQMLLRDSRTFRMECAIRVPMSVQFGA
ncbi:MAG: FAD-dependent oxidoreductase [Arhodomonas sp.]|nr:FAD-dependent oxidoreductase [Arhodomonas sp.]